MGDYYCNSCDKTIKLKLKKKHLNTKSHTNLSEFIINKYCVKNPELIDEEKRLQKHVHNYKKRFEFYHIICEWKLQFIDTNIYVEKRMYSNALRGLIENLIKKIDYFRRQGLRFSHILEMNITFRTWLHLLTYEHYINQPMQMVERVLNKKTI